MFQKFHPWCIMLQTILPEDKLLFRCGVQKIEPEKIILITSVIDFFEKGVFMQKSRKLQVSNPQRKSIPKHMDLRGRKHPLSFKVL